MVLACVTRYCFLYEIFFHIALLLNVGCRCAKSHDPSDQCQPLVTVDNAAISTASSRPVAKAFLGNYTKLSSCVRECCQRVNCDLVLFNGRRCYGVLCTTKRVCQLHTARNGRTSFKAVLLDKIVKDKSTTEDLDDGQSATEREVVLKEMNLVQTHHGRKRKHNKHSRKTKLWTKKRKISFNKKKTSTSKRMTHTVKKLRHDKMSRYKAKKMIPYSTNRAYYHSGQQLEDPNKCYVRRTAVNATLRSGMDSGIFKLHGKSLGIKECVELCCKDQTCDIALIMTNICYTVQCFSDQDCECKSVQGVNGVIMAYVDNPLKSHRIANTGTKVVHPGKHSKEIEKKTVVPDPSQGNVGDILDSVRFLNGPSTVTSDMRFDFLQQCALYVEPENATKTVHGWVTPRYTPVKYLYQFPTGTPPPLGMRSAVPLGGMGTGSFELRADGTFHEWTLENQSPGGSAKLGPGALDLATIGVRVSSSLGTKAALLRTHPPPGYPGVEALSYSGSFPVSKLGVKDKGFFGVEMDLFAYGTLRPRRTDSSIVPGIAFTLMVKNPTERAVNVSFLLNLPLGKQPDTSRDGSNIESITEVESSAQCAAMCSENARCMAWSYERNNCTLKDVMPLHAYRDGVSSGVKGYWKINGDMLVCDRPGNYPNSGSTTVLSINTNKPSFAVADDFRSVWEAFQTSGRLRKRIESTGFHGTISVSARLPPGITETLTIILAWYYPYRDHVGQTVGQYYGKLFKSSMEVADHVRSNLLTNLQDIIAWQENMISPKPLPTPPQGNTTQSSLPEWLQDHLVNSLSFWRSGFRVADGRWRQWEALDCNDVDSVHNDFQRELPYLLFFPELLESVVRAWAKFQDRRGWIQETLQMQWGCHNRTNRLDTPGGRVMADVTPAFLAQFYHLYLWTGNEKLLQDLWPAARKAVIWLMRNSTGGTWLPLRQTCTYDIIYLEGYDHTTYNSVMYLLGMRVGQALAQAQGDTELARTIEQAFNFGQSKMDRTLWDEKDGFYHAWWDHEKGSPDWLMADSLYGQVWAYALGLGDLLDPVKMKRHLQKERENNDTPYGLRVLTQGTADHNFQAAIHKEAVVMRQRRETRGTNALASLDSFFSKHKASDLGKGFGREEGNTTGKKENGLGTTKIFKPKKVPAAHNITYNGTALQSEGKKKNGIEMTKIPKLNNVPAANSIAYNETASRSDGQQEKRMKTTKTPKLKNGPAAHNIAYNGSVSRSGGKQEKRMEMTKSLELKNDPDAHYIAYNETASDRKQEKKSTIVKRKQKHAATIKEVGDTARRSKIRSMPPLTQETLNHENCFALEKESKFNSIWMGSDSDWTTLQIHLGTDPTTALKQAEKALEHYRTKLNDLWNIHGLTAGQGYGVDGQPWCTSHYSFHMVLWHIPLAISGQRYTAVEKRLTFEPKLKVPYALPFFTPFASGTIKARSSNNHTKYTVTVTAGKLDVKLLAISKSMYPRNQVNIGQGEYVSWERK